MEPAQSPPRRLDDGSPAAEQTQHAPEGSEDPATWNACLRVRTLIQHHEHSRDWDLFSTLGQVIGPARPRTPWTRRAFQCCRLLPVQNRFLAVVHLCWAICELGGLYLVGAL